MTNISIFYLCHIYALIKLVERQLVHGFAYATLFSKIGTRTKQRRKKTSTCKRKHTYFLITKNQFIFNKNVSTPVCLRCEKPFVETGSKKLWLSKHIKMNQELKTVMIHCVKIAFHA